MLDERRDAAGSISSPYRAHRSPSLCGSASMPPRSMSSPKNRSKPAGEMTSRMRMDLNRTALSNDGSRSEKSVSRSAHHGERIRRRIDGMTTHAAAALLCALVGVSGASAQPVSFSRADYPNDAGARGIVAADFDGDGAVDFATANNAGRSVTIFLNRLATHGGFVRAHTYAMSAGPFGIAAGDFNRDGRIDLAVAAADADRIELLIGSGDGAFTRAAPISAP